MTTIESVLKHLGISPDFTGEIRYLVPVQNARGEVVLAPGTLTVRPGHREAAASRWYDGLNPMEGQLF